MRKNNRLDVGGGRSLDGLIWCYLRLTDGVTGSMMVCQAWQRCLSRLEVCSALCVAALLSCGEQGGTRVVAVGVGTSASADLLHASSTQNYEIGFS